MPENNKKIPTVEENLQVLNKVVNALHMTEVLVGEGDDNGVSSFIILFEDREGNKYGSTVACKSAYQEYVIKAFQRLQGVPLPPLPSKEDKNGANTEG